MRVRSTRAQAHPCRERENAPFLALVLHESTPLAEPTKARHARSMATSLGRNGDGLLGLAPAHPTEDAPRPA
jgi:hypothetical protein